MLGKRLQRCMKEKERVSIRENKDMKIAGMLRAQVRVLMMSNA
jgi:hypothetical protein